jgi:hypothetical protein
MGLYGLESEKFQAEFRRVIPSGRLKLAIGKRWYPSTGHQGSNPFYGAPIRLFGIVVSGLLGYAVGAFGMAQTAKARLLRISAEHGAIVRGESTAFDPLANVYENKRLYLRDLAPVGRRFVQGKTFINCEIIGPGSALLGVRSSEHRPFPNIRDSAAYDVDCIEIDPSKQSMLAISFPDCDFIGCQFFHMTLLSTQRDNETLHWITKDSRQALLPDSEAGIEGMELGQENH